MEICLTKENFPTRNVSDPDKIAQNYGVLLVGSRPLFEKLLDRIRTLSWERFQRTFLDSVQVRFFFFKQMNIQFSSLQGKHDQNRGSVGNFGSQLRLAQKTSRHIGHLWKSTHVQKVISFVFMEDFQSWIWSITLRGSKGTCIIFDHFSDLKKVIFKRVQEMLLSSLKSNLPLKLWVLQEMNWQIK